MIWKRLKVIMYREKKWKYTKSRTKYNNQSKEYNGRVYHSKFEAKVAQDLDLRLSAGEIKEVIPQFKIRLDVGDFHICNYYVDFKVIHNDGSIEYIEVKGFETQLWRLKWKLFEALYADKENIILTVIKQR